MRDEFLRCCDRFCIIGMGLVQRVRGFIGMMSNSSEYACFDDFKSASIYLPLLEAEVQGGPPSYKPYKWPYKYLING